MQVKYETKIPSLRKRQTMQKNGHLFVIKILILVIQIYSISQHPLCKKGYESKSELVAHVNLTYNYEKGIALRTGSMYNFNLM